MTEGHDRPKKSFSRKQNKRKVQHLLDSQFSESRICFSSNLTLFWQRHGSSVIVEVTETTPI